MIPMCQAMLGEIQQEAATTRRVLERIPENKLAWKPHQKSMTIGQLAMHTAQVPGAIANLSQPDEFDASQADFTPGQPKSMGEIFAAHDEGIRAAEDCLKAMTQERADATWRLKMGTKGSSRHSARRAASLDHVKPLVPPSRPALRLFAIAGCSRALDLRAKRGREPVRLIPHATARDEMLKQKGQGRAVILFRAAFRGGTPPGLLHGTAIHTVFFLHEIFAAFIRQ